MSKLAQYSRTSAILDISIKWGEEVFKFNLQREIKIPSQGISEAAKSHPSSYAFLTLLHKKLIGQVADFERHLKRLYAKEFISRKSGIDKSTGRPKANELVDKEIISNPKYILLEERLAKAQKDLLTIEACVKAFEQRASLIQTISANQRKERE